MLSTKLEISSHWKSWLAVCFLSTPWSCKHWIKQKQTKEWSSNSAQAGWIDRDLPNAHQGKRGPMGPKITNFTGKRASQLCVVNDRYDTFDSDETICESLQPTILCCEIQIEKRCWILVLIKKINQPIIPRAAVSNAVRLRSQKHT